MDGVIVDSMPHHLDSWKHVFGELGIALEDVDIYSREGMTGLESIKEIFVEKGATIPDDDGIEKLLLEKHDHYEKKKIALFPYVRDILQLLVSKNIATGLVTGSMRRAVEHSIPSEVLSLFTAVVSADDVSVGKPHPEPYCTALRRIGSNPGASLVVENAPLGIESAEHHHTFHGALPEFHMPVSNCCSRYVSMHCQKPVCW